MQDQIVAISVVTLQIPDILLVGIYEVAMPDLSRLHDLIQYVAFDRSIQATAGNAKWKGDQMCQVRFEGLALSGK